MSNSMSLIYLSQSGYINSTIIYWFFFSETFENLSGTIIILLHLKLLNIKKMGFYVLNLNKEGPVDLK